MKSLKNLPAILILCITIKYGYPEIYYQRIIDSFIIDSNLEISSITESSQDDNQQSNNYLNDSQWYGMQHNKLNLNEWQQSNDCNDSSIDTTPESPHIDELQPSMDPNLTQIPEAPNIDAIKPSFRFFFNSLFFLQIFF